MGFARNSNDRVQTGAGRGTQEGGRAGGRDVSRNSALGPSGLATHAGSIPGATKTLTVESHQEVEELGRCPEISPAPRLILISTTFVGIATVALLCDRLSRTAWTDAAVEVGIWGVGRNPLQVSCATPVRAATTQTRGGKPEHHQGACLPCYHCLLQFLVTTESARASSALDPSASSCLDVLFWVPGACPTSAGGLVRSRDQMGHKSVALNWSVFSKRLQLSFLRSLPSQDWRESCKKRYRWAAGPAGWLTLRREHQIRAAAGSGASLFPGCLRREPTGWPGNPTR
jgi:hypothetical protein